jgi:Fe-S cluster assembly ATPase SufC
MRNATCIESVDITTEMTVPLLRTVDLDFSYGKLQVLFGVNIEVSKGEALALLGTNGTPSGAAGQRRPGSHTGRPGGVH